MKKLFLIFNLFLVLTFLFSQNVRFYFFEKQNSFLFTKKNLSNNVNGINVGVLDAYDGQKINGFNLQFNRYRHHFPVLVSKNQFPAPEKWKCF